jgi:phosphoribosylglycinamide formyltransferase-1
MSFGRIRWALFISGTGSNLNAVLDMRDHIDVAVVVSSKRNAPGLLKARRAGVPTIVLEKNINWNLLHEELLRHRVDRIFLLGFMKILPEDFVSLWKGRALNVHPSLLPKYPGLNGVEQAIEKRDLVGVTTHEVVAQMDAGEAIFQKVVLDPKMIPLDLEHVENLVHLCEHRLVRESVRKWKVDPT